MNIISLKPGHDGNIAIVADGHLVRLIEAEKDSGLRYAQLDLDHLLFDDDIAFDAIAISGWARGANPKGASIGAGYLGLEKPQEMKSRLLGSSPKVFSSSHERSHILCSYALSPFPQGTRCYCLVWEGYIGSFYYVGEQMEIRQLANIMVGPGVRYSFAYALADQNFNLPPGSIRLGDAGKLMALAAYEEAQTQPSDEEKAWLSQIFQNPDEEPFLNKADFSECKFFNCGVGSYKSKRLARLVSDYIISYFIDKMRPHIAEKLPLLIGGGCGLNCDWNRLLLDTELFADVFVPPVTNDTGSSIGTAADLQFLLTGDAKLNWDTYSGLNFQDDLRLFEIQQVQGYDFVGSDPTTIARALKAGAIIGWTAGRMEIGPRALGNRSILAEPFLSKTTSKLNKIKKREVFRPIAPICRLEEVNIHFDLTRQSPHMLFFTSVKNKDLRAITHVDGSARVQTVTADQNKTIYDVLSSFQKLTGCGVLCNTSLNEHGRGFINKSSDLVKYASSRTLDGLAVQGRLFLRNPGKFVS